MARGGRGGGGGGGGGGFGGGSFGGGRSGGSRLGGSRGRSGGHRLGGGASRGRGGTNRNTGSGSNRNSGGGYRPGGFWGPRPFFGGWGGYGYGGYGGYGPRRRYNRGGCGTGCGGCLTGIIVLFFVLILFNFMWGSVPGNNNTTAVESVQVNSSTIEREPIEAGLVNETSYYVDNLGWIRDAGELEDGLRYFYDKTNIQPVVYITDNIDGDANPDPQTIDDFALNLYDEMFTDGAHLLLVHFDNWDFYDYEYSFHLVMGDQTQTVMDNEAVDILYDYLEYHYYRDISEEEFFSESFRDTADRIMTVTRSPWIPVFIIIGAAVVIYLLYNWWRRALGKNQDDTKQAGDTTSTEEKKDGFDEFDF